MRRPGSAPLEWFRGVRPNRLAHRIAPRFLAPGCRTRRGSSWALSVHRRRRHARNTGASVRCTSCAADPAQPLYGPRHHTHCGIDVGLGGIPAEAETQAAFSKTIVAAQGAQYIGRLLVDRGAGGAGRYGDMRPNGCEQALSLDALERHVEQVGHRALEVAVAQYAA